VNHCDLIKIIEEVTNMCLNVILGIVLDMVYSWHSSSGAC